VGIIDKVDPKNHASWQIIGTGKVSEVLQKRLHSIEPGDLGPGEDFENKDQMIHTFKKYYGPDVNENTAVKIISFDFTPQQPQQLEAIESKNTSNLTEVKLFADGGSRGNPGPSASGYVLTTMEDVVVYEGGEYLGITTNNQAEYSALNHGLQEAIERGAQHVNVFMDSLLVVNQMKGIYKIKNRELMPLFQKAHELVKHFDSVKFTHVPRELNKLADGMVNEILDASLT
jgi:ribonuclease HI